MTKRDIAEQIGELISMTNKVQDQWAQWLLQRRHGGDPQVQQAMLAILSQIRDTVLQNARIAQGNILLDVGCGDGLIAFGALSLVGEQGKVLFCDISQNLLDHCHTLAQQMGVLDRCQFLQASADNLHMIESNSVDAVTARSVLVYVQDKMQALREFYRVLKPGGRLSIFEPIPRFMYPEPPHLLHGYDITPVMPIAQKLRAVYERSQFAQAGSPSDFDERDLLKFLEDVGFTEIYLALQISIVPGTSENASPLQKPSWEAFLKTSLNPLAPTLEEAMHQALTTDEANQFTRYFRPLVETGQKVDRLASAYLGAVKH
jgi:ubiquinone/menaquinone biosynthesis C-methylase UbiE